MHVEHLRVPVGNGALHVERVGRGGEPVVLLHGFGTCAFLWRNLAPVLAHAGFTTYAIDLLGHGESDRPDEALYSLRAQAEYVARAIAALRFPRAHFVGQDIGALVALLVAAQSPAAVASLALLSAPDPDDLPGPEIRQLQRTSARLALSGGSLFGALPALAPLLRSAVSDATRMPELLVARYLAPFVGNDGLAQLLRRAAAIELEPGTSDPWAPVAVPTLLIESAGTDTQEAPSEWARRLPAAQVETRRFAGGRLLPEDAPEALAEGLLSWLTRQRNG